MNVNFSFVCKNDKVILTTISKPLTLTTVHLNYEKDFENGTFWRCQDTRNSSTVWIVNQWWFHIKNEVGYVQNKTWQDCSMWTWHTYRPLSCRSKLPIPWIHSRGMWCVIMQQGIYTFEINTLKLQQKPILTSISVNASSFINRVLWYGDRCEGALSTQTRVKIMDALFLIIQLTQMNWLELKTWTLKFLSRLKGQSFLYDKNTNTIGDGKMQKCWNETSKAMDPVYCQPCLKQ